MRGRHAVLAAVALVLVWGQACGGEPTPEQRRDEAALALVKALAEERYEEAAERFTPELREVLPPTRLRRVWERLTGSVGPFGEVLDTNQMRQRGHWVVVVRCSFERSEVSLPVVFDEEGRVSSLWFGRAMMMEGTARPAYVDPDAFDETPVTVGEPPWELPGLLAMPRGDGPFPSLVLVHGSGPLDRDETAYQSKPFLDLAQGLASNGIAVLRYDKRTLVYGSEVAAHLAEITVKEETVDDTLAAVALLRRTEGVHPARVFVLGHGLGGTLAPRIAERDAGIAGFILMAAPARPLQDVFLDQTTYVYCLDGAISVVEQDRLRETQREVARIGQLRPSDAGSGEPLLGWAPRYWLDLRGYDPVRAAERVAAPMLVIHGGRDYEATTADFEAWRAALGSRADVEMREYPDLNHMLVWVWGGGKSSPQEYNWPGHVAESVVSDIASWIRKH